MALSVISITPDTIAQGQVFTATIAGTDFVDGAQVTFSAVGVTATDVAFVDDDELTVTLFVAHDAELDAGDVTVTNPDEEEDTLGGGFTVTAAPEPQISTVSPEATFDGRFVDFAVTGLYFMTVPGVTAELSVEAIDVLEVIVHSSTSITVRTMVPPRLEPQDVDLTIQNPDDQSATAQAIISVEAVSPHATVRKLAMQAKGNR
jgi:hypothetical protein